jgi:hypothetical protein
MTAYDSEEGVDAHNEDVLLDSSSDSWSNAAVVSDDVTKRRHTSGSNTIARHLAATRLGVYVLPAFLISFLAEADSVVVENPGWSIWTRMGWEGRREEGLYIRKP